MPAPSSGSEFLELVRKSQLVNDERLQSHLDKLRSTGALPTQPPQIAGVLVRDGLLTHFQAEQLLQGKWRRFNIGKYKVLERLGSGGMGHVYLCEHQVMRRKVALKVLPTAKAEDPAALDRFIRESRAVAALDHPNIVRAYDIDHEDKLHFLVMEHVDGASLQEMIKRAGPMDVTRAAHYMRQAALGLEHAFETAGLVHRDIKPGNILVDRSGIVKILDMGLARFFYNEDDDITKKYDENVLGTADYLAPEQALNSHEADIRADIYSLGATFYFCLTGRPPFAEGTVAQKLIWHQTRKPKSVTEIRDDVPAELLAVLDRMMAKDRDDRFQYPREVAEALVPWTQHTIPPPPEKEMPQLSPAAKGANSDVSARRAATQSGWEVAGGSSKTSGHPSSSPTTPSTPNPKAPPLTPAPGTPRSSPAPIASGPPPTRPSLLQATPVSPTAHPKPAASTGEIQVDEAPWEEIASDTDDLTSRIETHRTRTTTRRRATEKAPKTNKLWLMIGGGALLGLIVIVILLIALGGSEDNPKGGTQPGSTLTRTLYVGGAVGDGKVYQTVNEALRQARPGDRIIVRSPVVHERVDLSELGRDGRKFLKGVTLEAASGKEVIWRSPLEVGRQAQEPLIFLHDVEGFQVKGFKLDGKNQVRNLIVLSYSCPGVTLENLELWNYTYSGIFLVNCMGTPENKVTIRAVEAKNAKAPGLFFKVLKTTRDNPKTNDHILVENVTFPMRPPVKYESVTPDTSAMGSDVILPAAFPKK